MSIFEEYIGIFKYIEVVGIFKFDGLVKRNFVIRKSIFFFFFFGDSLSFFNIFFENGDVEFFKMSF